MQLRYLYTLPLTAVQCCRKTFLEDDHDTFVVHANLYIKPGIGQGSVSKMASVEAGVKGRSMQELRQILAMTRLE